MTIELVLKYRKEMTANCNSTFNNNILKHKIISFQTNKKSKTLHHQQTNSKGNIKRCPLDIRTMIANIKLSFLTQVMVTLVCLLYNNSWICTLMIYKPLHICIIHCKNLIKSLPVYKRVCLCIVSLHFFSIKRHQIGSESFIGCSNHEQIGMNKYSLFLTDFSRERKNEKAATLCYDACTNLMCKLQKEGIKMWRM